MVVIVAAILFIRIHNSNKMHTWEPRISNACSWDKRKFLTGKHGRDLHLGLPCINFIPGIQLLSIPASLKTEKSFKVASTKKRKPEFSCSLRNKCNAQDNHQVWQLLCWCHTSPNIPTYPIIKDLYPISQSAVTKLPTSNDSWDGAASSLPKRLIQREQTSAPQIILKIHPRLFYLGRHPLHLNSTPLGHPKAALPSWAYTFQTLIKQCPGSPILLAVQPK